MRNQGKAWVVQSALFFETPEQIYARVFRQSEAAHAGAADRRSNSAAFANANASSGWKKARCACGYGHPGRRRPAPVIEALAYICWASSSAGRFRRSTSHRYRLYLNRRDVRQQAAPGAADPRAKVHVRSPRASTTTWRRSSSG